ncbi:MAG: hypothetical protein P8J64_08215 [Dehalococcoidia bacterium]|nr:hypothetical protein [Dehalococcoidia bacterium]
MDSSARWFLAGIFVSLINTAFVALFIFGPRLPEVFEVLASDSNSSRAGEISVSATEITYKIVVIDERSDVVFWESGLSDEAINKLVEELRVNPTSQTDADTESVMETVLVQESVAKYDQKTIEEFAFSDGRDVIPLTDKVAVLHSFEGSAWLISDNTMTLKAFGKVLNDGFTEVPISGIGVHSSSGATALTLDRSGHLWVLLTENDGWRVIKKTFNSDSWLEVVSHLNTEAKFRPTDIAVGDDRSIYLSSSYPPALYRYRQATKQIEIVSPINDAASAVTYAPTGMIVSGGSRAAIAFDHAELQVLFIEHSAVSEITPDSATPGEINRAFNTWADAYPNCEARDLFKVRTAETKNLLRNPLSVGMADNGRVLLVDFESNVVFAQAYQSSGEILWGNKDCSAGDSGRGLSGPTSAAMDEDKNLLIIDDGNSRILFLPSSRK